MYKNDEPAAVYEMERARLRENSCRDFCQMCGGSAKGEEAVCTDCRTQLLRARLHEAVSALDDDVRAVIAALIDDGDLKDFLEEE